MREFKRVFVVDSENTGNYSFVKKLNLGEDDLVYIMCSPRSIHVDVYTMASLIQSKCQVDFLSIDFTGSPDYMDYQILCLVGALCGRFYNSLTHCYVVSCDKIFKRIDKGFCQMFRSVSFGLVNPSDSRITEIYNSNSITDSNSNSTIDLDPSELNLEVSEIAVDGHPSDLQELLKSHVSIESVPLKKVNYKDFVLSSNNFTLEHKVKVLDICSKVNSRQELHNELVKSLPNGIKVYNMIKDKVFV